MLHVKVFVYILKVWGDDGLEWEAPMGVKSWLVLHVGGVGGAHGGGWNYPRALKPQISIDTSNEIISTGKNLVER